MAQSEKELSLDQAPKLVEQASSSEKGEQRNKLDAAWEQGWHSLVDRVAKRGKELPELTKEEICADFTEHRREQSKEIRNYKKNSPMLDISLPTSAYRLAALTVGALTAGYCMAFIANGLLIGIPVYLSFNPQDNMETKVLYFRSVGESCALHGLAGAAVMLTCIFQHKVSRSPALLQGRAILLGFVLSAVLPFLSACVLGLSNGHLAGKIFLLFIPVFLKTYALSGLWGGLAAIATVIIVSSRGRQSVRIARTENGKHE